MNTTGPAIGCCSVPIGKTAAQIVVRGMLMVQIAGIILMPIRRHATTAPAANKMPVMPLRYMTTVITTCDLVPSAPSSLTVSRKKL